MKKKDCIIDTFPYWKYSLPSPETMFNTLKSQKIDTIKEGKNILVVRKYPDDYILTDHLSNHFTEDTRVHCIFSKNKSPYTVWKDIMLIPDVIKKDKYNQREHVYGLTRECNTFNPTYCLFIIRTLVGSNAKIIDPSSGWGDRLIASIASDCSVYHGYDPNKKLQKGYKEIIKTFKGSSNSISRNFSVKCKPFESVKVKKNYYDLGITSPPYFSLEEYDTEDPNQSSNRYNTYPKWLLFYKEYLTNLVNAIRPGGYVSIYIEDIYYSKEYYPLKKETLTIMSELPVDFYSEIGLKVGKPRWSIIWKKK